MQYKTESRLAALLAGILIASVIVPGCAEKIANSSVGDGSTVIVRTRLGAAAPSAAVSHYRLIVQAVGIETIVVPLELQGPYLVGEVEVPMGPARRFTAEALDSQGVVIYRGTTVADIDEASAINDPYTDASMRIIYIDLYPVAPLVRITPHFQSVAMNYGFSVDISVYLVPDLYSIDFSLTFSDILATSPPMDFETILIGQDLDTTNSTLTYGIGGDSARIQVFRQTPGILVDSTGHAHLATCHFWSHPEYQFDTANVILQVELFSMYRYDGAGLPPIPIESVYTDQAHVELFRIQFAGD